MKLGIDFGTTTSEAATSRTGAVGEKLAGPIPSLVHYWPHRDPELHIGCEVTYEDRDQLYSSGLMRDIKMYLGRGEYLNANGKKIAPEEMAAAIIKQIIEFSRKKFLTQNKGADASIEKLCISVPGRFDAARLLLLRNAVSKASGIDVKDIDLIAEPVAAALYMYEAEEVEQNSRTILVFDMGGGTLDCSIVRKTDDPAKPYEEIATDTVSIAGRNFDSDMVDVLETNAKKQQGVDLGGCNPVQLLTWAEETKKQLTNNSETTTVVNVDGETCLVSVTRDEFEAATQQTLKKGLDFMDQLLKDHVDERIDEIICVGGSSCMPMIKRGIEKRQPDIPVHVKKPELAIAFGAAIHADSNPVTKIALKASHTYAVRYNDRDTGRLMLDGLILRGQELPSKSTRMYCTAADNQRSAPIKVYKLDGASERVVFDQECHGDPILEITLPIKRPCPKGSLIDVTLTLDRNRILQAEGRLRTGETVTGTVEVL
ncbi:2-alkenal reductase [Bifidobacterium pseudolongum subsp. globosum]|uniref:2-alkenal reductase n=1 Tax=Bifidobacterium pseudolongum subsp. globosum TaxID=1690 RepID=A0A4Q5AFZ1_9BIFI|nr:Hsp70 family protein [Bifidobacterium pseudolongum]RYQ26624.1 2-alkenal reductase [Bifidobacterium pseudolongum subsp. globosum]RYQ28616.1 2-alkenal reductase [Bifidobacterium pseudolongum subsp. globosum]